MFLKELGAPDYIVVSTAGLFSIAIAFPTLLIAALGRNIIMASAKKIKKFPSELLLQIEHIMLAQYNFKEGESQVNPMFKETLLVSMITSLDSQMSIMKKIIEDDQDSQDFTSHYNFFKTTIYKKS